MGVILFFGGGMALAKGFEVSGLAFWIGSQMTSLAGLPFFMLIFILILAVNFMTEITSNLATTAMLLPIPNSNKYRCASFRIDGRFYGCRIMWVYASCCYAS